MPNMKFVSDMVKKNTAERKDDNGPKKKTKIKKSIKW